MEKLGTPIKEGKAKILFRTDEGTILMRFKDDLTALDGLKHDQMAAKGKYNSVISARLLEQLESEGIATHLIRLVEPGLMEVRQVEMIPIEVVYRNVAMGSIVRRLGLTPGTRFTDPVVEYYLKSDELHDPWINEDHIILLGLASREELARIRDLTIKVNDALSRFLDGRGLVLADFKVEFGRLDGELLVADEITCDSMRLLDKDAFSQGSIVEYDKQIFRDGGSKEEVANAYRNAYKRIVGEDPPF